MTTMINPVGCFPGLRCDSAKFTRNTSRRPGWALHLFLRTAVRLRCEVANYSPIRFSDLYGFPLIFDASNAFKPHWILSSSRLAVACNGQSTRTTVRLSSRERMDGIANFMPDCTRSSLARDVPDVAGLRSGPSTGSSVADWPVNRLVEGLSPESHAQSCTCPGGEGWCSPRSRRLPDVRMRDAAPGRAGLAHRHAPSGRERDGRTCARRGPPSGKSIGSAPHPVRCMSWLEKSDNADCCSRTWKTLVSRDAKRID